MLKQYEIECTFVQYLWRKIFFGSFKYWKMTSLF